MAPWAVVPLGPIYFRVASGAGPELNFRLSGQTRGHTFCESSLGLPSGQSWWPLKPEQRVLDISGRQVVPAARTLQTLLEPPWPTPAEGSDIGSEVIERTKSKRTGGHWELRGHSAWRESQWSAFPGGWGGEVKQKTVLKDGEVLLIDARSTCRPPAWPASIEDTHGDRALITILRPRFCQGLLRGPCDKDHRHSGVHSSQVTPPYIPALGPQRRYFINKVKELLPEDRACGWRGK